jgi:hypothetical protein
MLCRLKNSFATTKAELYPQPSEGGTYESMSSQNTDPNAYLKREIYMQNTGLIPWRISKASTTDTNKPMPKRKVGLSILNCIY